MPRPLPEVEMTDARQKIWEALKALDEQREKHQGAMSWPPQHRKIADAADVPEGTVKGTMVLFRLAGYIDYEPGERLLFLREPAVEARA